MRPTTKQIQQATKKYNDIMYCLCLDHLTIGTKASENTGENWNLRDMVSECQYNLDMYYEDGTCSNELRYEDYKAWVSETGKLRRFIDHWKPYVSEMKCAIGHCSKFD